MKEFWSRLSQIKHFDKVLHFSACLIVTLAGSFVDLWLGVGLGVGAGLGKEVGDYYNPNSKFSVWDLVADALGIVSGAMFIKFIENYL